MDDFGRVGGQRFVPLRILVRNQLKYRGQFGERSLPCRHERVAAWYGWHLCDPTVRLVSVKHDFIVVETHSAHFSPLPISLDPSPVNRAVLAYPLSHESRGEKTTFGPGMRIHA